MGLTVRRLAVVAHFDAERHLAASLRLMLDDLRSVCERVVVVSTSGLDVDGRAWFADRDGIVLLERPNEGYDFKSFQEGYRELGAVGAAEVVFANDSFVGPFLPLATVFRAMEARDVDYWGMTQSIEYRPHVQSYFMVFRRHVVRHEAFDDFWRGFGTPRDRAEAVAQGELELSRRLDQAGFRGGAYFEPNDDDVVAANQRFAYLTLPDEADSAALTRHWAASWRARIGSSERMRFNSTILLADRALSGRLPLLKLEVARLDPAELGGPWLVQALSDDLPVWFEGIHDVRRRTTAGYRSRYRARGLPLKVPDVYPTVRYQFPRPARSTQSGP